MTLPTETQAAVLVDYGSPLEVRSCAHCAHALDGGPADYLSRLPFYESTVDAAGPQVFTGSRVFVDTDVVFRQYICPGCATAFLTEVVPVVKAEAAS